MNRNRSDVLLCVPLNAAYLPVVTGAVEKTALAMGLGPNESLSMTLAMEEVFSYTSAIVRTSDRMTLRLEAGGYCMRAICDLPVSDFDMGAFNITAVVRPDDPESVAKMGLLLASRAVDRLQIERSEAGGIRLVLIREKAYAPVSHDPQTLPGALNAFQIREPGPEEIGVMVGLINLLYPAYLFPGAFRFPEKVVDMVAWGDLQVLMAVDDAGHPGGGIFWGWFNEKTVECAGPYVFNQPALSETIAGRLLNASLEAVARTKAIGFLCQFPTGHLPETEIETLGTLSLFSAEGPPRRIPAWFRLLREDPGAVVWAHPDLKPYLLERYRELVLPREVRPVEPRPERRPARSVLSSDVYRQASRVILRPLGTGDDIPKNVADHLGRFSSEPIRHILFEMDLGIPWHADFTPALLENGFEPRLILPYAGKRDLVVFQWEEPSK